MKFIKTNQAGRQLAIVDNIYSMERTRNINGTDTLDVECGTHFDKGDRIIFLDSRKQPQEYLLSDMEEAREDGKPVGSYHFTLSWHELSATFIEDKRVRGGNAMTALTRVLEGTRWTVGAVESSGVGNTDISFYRISAAEAIQNICETFNLELTVTYTLSADGGSIAGRSINLLKQQGNPQPQRFQYGHNLTAVTRSIDPTDVVTRLYPYGASVQETDESGEATGGYSRKIDISSVNDGKTYIEDVEATARWGIPDAQGVIQPLSGTRSYDDIEDPQALKDAAEADLPSMVNPLITYEGDIAAMGIIGRSRGMVDVGDMVMIIDTTFDPPVYAQGRVSEVVDNPMTPGKGMTVTLGTLQTAFTTSSDDILSQVDGLLGNKDAWDNAANLTPSYITSLINQLNGQLNETGGYTYLTPGEGIIIYDKPVDQDPTMAIQLGGGFLRIANSKNADGTWEWRTFGTGDGFTADLLNVGTIKGGANTWNLETGEVIFQQGSIRNDDDSLVIDMDSGDVTLTKGTIGNPEGNNWNLTTGDLTIRDGEISISGYVDGHYTTTTIDASGFHVTGGGTEAGTGVSDNQVTLRSTTLGEDDRTYLKIEGNTLQVYLSGTLAFQITLNSASEVDLSTNGSPFMKLGDPPSGAYFKEKSVVIRVPDSSHYMQVASTGLEFSSDTGVLLVDSDLAGLYVSGGIGFVVRDNSAHVYGSGSTGNSRLDCPSSYCAICYGNNHVMVNASGITFTPALNNLSAASTANYESRMMSLAENNVVLDSPENVDSVPMAIDEVSITQIHDVLRALCDGDTEKARTLLDDAEANARTYSAHDLDMLRHGLDLTMEER